MKYLCALLVSLALWLPHVLHAYEADYLFESPEADYAYPEVTVAQAISISVIDKDAFLVFRIVLRVTPDFPAEYVYAEKKVTITSLPAAPEPEPVFYFNESSFRFYEPWGFDNCFHTFSWGELGGPDMICSPEPFIGF